MASASGLTGGAIQIAAGTASGGFTASATVLGQATPEFDAQLATSQSGAVGEFDAKVCVEIGVSAVVPSAVIITPTLVNSSGIPPWTIAFSGDGYASGAKTITNYTWFFNDMKTAVSGGRSVEYTFSNSGSFLVTLRVTDSDGLVGYDSRRILTYSGIALDLPELQITASPQGGDAPILVDFTASGGAVAGTDIRGYSWSFGHGKFSRKQNPNDISYNSPGDYLPVCTMSDSRGVRVADSLTVGVNN